MSLFLYNLFQGVHWEHVNSPQSLISISTCNYNVWAVGRKGELYYRQEISKDNPGGINWKLIEPPKGTNPYHHKAVGAKSVSLTKTAAWVLLYNGSIAVRTNISKDKPEGKNWKYISGK